MTTIDPRKLPRVLYIEDDASSRVVVRRLLAARYVVLEAADPLNGLQLADETQPHLILLDQNLPHMPGSEVAPRLRTMLPNKPLVIVSADDTGARGHWRRVRQGLSASRSTRRHSKRKWKSS